MAYTLWSQDVFSKGVLSPMLYARASVKAYYNGLKVGNNVLTYPQGAAGKRFGTKYLNELNSAVTSYEQVYFKSFQYLNECVYLVVMRPDNIDIYLEGILIATVPSTGLDQADIRGLDHTVLESRFRVCIGRETPRDLRRAASERFTISSIDTGTDLITIPSSFTTNDVYPVVFTTEGTIPASTPTIVSGTTYYLRAFSATTFKVYASDANARSDTSAFNITSSGSGTNYATVTYSHEIASIDTGTGIITVTEPFTASDLILAVRFTTTGTLPTSTPRIRASVTYFVYTLSTTTCLVYASAQDAKDGVNAFTISAAGSGNFINVSNSWSYDAVQFKNIPSYDFNDTNYDGFTFTLGATSGNNINLATAAGQFVFTPEHVGGAFFGQNGGIARIITYNSNISVQVDILETFGVSANKGALSILREPAWSDLRGWPRKCSSFQSRAFFANTDSLNNGVWGSSINSYNDFDDLQRDDDDAISWYPTSDNINYIQYIVPYRSLTVHTNSGVYSSPLSFETAITPNNFSLTLQDSTPADTVQPRAIDNQILVVSGNDVHSMIWDGNNNAYSSTIISLTSEQLITNPIDETAYADLSRAGSRYLFIINADGTMAMLQTLISQDISGWTPASLFQSYGNAYFRWATSNFDGRAWFVNEREIAQAQTPVAIASFDEGAQTFTATGVGFSTSEPTACQFTTTGTLPTTAPQIELLTYYWAVGIDADSFYLYESIEDATSDDNKITPTVLGSNSNVVPYTLDTKFFIEELDFDAYVDCADFYSGAPASSITGVSRFNAQSVKINGDGYGFEGEGNGGEVDIVAHGESVEITDAQVGFPIKVEITPMPLSISLGQSSQNTNLVEPKHIRSATFMFDNTTGGTINGKPIALESFAQVPFGAPPNSVNGITNISVMKGWDDFNVPNFTIAHDEPFDIRLIGVFYKVEV